MAFFLYIYMRCGHSDIFLSCGLPGYESTVKDGDYPPPLISVLEGLVID